jgi:hypothetical protein
VCVVKTHELMLQGSSTISFCSPAMSHYLMLKQLLAQSV